MGSFFEKHKVLHALPKDGSKVTYSKPSKFAFFQSVIDNEKKLELGKTYTVRETELNSSSTYIWLEEFGTEREPFFNLGAFTWETPELDPKDLIGLDVRSCLKTGHFYKVGIEFDEKVFSEGSPMLVLEYDKQNNRVTNAYFKES